jgi:hypothetical protein
MAAATVTTETEVANLALQRIGIAVISDLDTPGTDKAALAVSRIFADTRDEVCRMFPWASITGRTAIAGSAAADSVFALKQTLAGTVLRVLGLLDVAGGTENSKYRMDGTTLYFTLAAGYIRHVTQTATVATWDPLLLEAIVLRLAGKLAFWLVGDMQLTVLMQQEFITEVSMAVATKAIEQHEDNKEVLTILNQQLQVLLLQKPGVV